MDPPSVSLRRATGTGLADPHRRRAACV